MTFNAIKTKASFYQQKEYFNLTPTFKNVFLEKADCIQVFGIKLFLNRNIGRFIESKA